MTQKSKVAICFIGTTKYRLFFEPFYASIKKFFLPDCEKTIFLFTDGEASPHSDVKTIKIQNKPWPYITLERFETILLVEEELKQFDWFVYLDADMLVYKPIYSSDFFNQEKEWFGVQHPGYINKIGTFEHRKKSRACVDSTKDLSTYWQGCLWGGQANSVLELCKELSNRTKEDLQEGLIAVWHDESHLNKFYVDNKEKVHTLDAGYAYPEKWTIPIEKKIIHVHKGHPPEEFLKY